MRQTKSFLFVLASLLGLAVATAVAPGAVGRASGAEAAQAGADKAAMEERQHPGQRSPLPIPFATADGPAPNNSPTAAEVKSNEHSPVPVGADLPPNRTVGEWLHELGDSVVRRNEPSVWLGFLIAVASGLVVGRLSAVGLRRAAQYLRRDGETVRSAAVGSIAGPTALLFLTVGLAIGAGLLTLDPTWRWLSNKSLALLGTLTAAWLFFNLIGVAEVALRRGAQSDGSSLDRQWLPLARKTLQVILAALVLLFVLDVVFERDIGAWLAGLGIAGIAVSLAAQDSLKNLFGSMTIIFDRPFLVGERIACLGFDGVVEEIGFRSTKLRTLAGNLVTIPNANLVNGPVENISRRPAIRRVFEVLLSRTVTGEQLARALEIVRAACADPELAGPIGLDVNGRPQEPIATISAVSPDGFVVALTYFYRPPDFVECNRHADRLLVRVVSDLRSEGIPLGVIRGTE